MLACVQNAEVAELKAVVFGKLRDNFIEELLHHCPDGYVLALSRRGDSAHEFFLCYYSHQPTFKLGFGRPLG